LIPKDADVIDNIDYEDSLWINDFCSISEYWYVDNEEVKNT
jgi:hypothetical protein